MLTYKPEEDTEAPEDVNSPVYEAKPEPVDDFAVSNDDPDRTQPHLSPTFNSQDPDDLLVIYLNSFINPNSCLIFIEK